MVADPNAVIVVAPELSRVNVEDAVTRLVRTVGLVPNINAPVPVLSGTRPLICVEVVDANVASVSDVYAMLPPNLQLTVTEAELLSDVKTKSLSTLRVLDDAISSVADAVDVIARPLIAVAVALPSCGADNTGDVRVLFVKVWDSFSVTNLFSTEPSHDLQYPPELYHCSCL